MIPPEPPVEPSPKWIGHRTARRAVDILLEHDSRYCCPNRAERDALLVGFARNRMTLFGAAYDVVRLEQHLDLSDRHQN